jgi:hypothetical protein
MKTLKRLQAVLWFTEKSETNKAERFPKYENMAINALIEAATKEGRIINSRYVANTETWREIFYSNRKHEDSTVKQEALKKAFQNAVKALILKKAVTQVNADSVLLLSDKQAAIHGAILAQNLLATQSRETGNLGKFPANFPLPAHGYDQRENGKFPANFPAG